jgi:hypothetical protein
LPQHWHAKAAESSHGVPVLRLRPPRLTAQQPRIFLAAKERKEHKEKNRIFPVKAPFFSVFSVAKFPIPLSYISRLKLSGGHGAAQIRYWALNVECSAPSPKFVSFRVIRVKMLSPPLVPFCGH